MSDTTAPNSGDIDAVAASLIEIEEPEVNDEDTAADADVEAAAPEIEAEAEDAEADGGEDDDGDGEGDDADEGEDATDDDTAEQLYTVKVNGREQQVPLSELLRGYSGQTAIQQGFREVASARKEVESVYSALQAERQQLAGFFQQLQQGEIPARPPEPPSDALLEKDPIGYLEQRVRYDKEVAKWQQAQQVMQEQSQLMAEQSEQARLAYLQEQQARLVQALPNLGKPETAAKVREDMIRAGVEVYGFSVDELQQVMDHRALVLLHDAAQYRKLMSGKARAEKQATQPRTPTLKPGTKVSATAGKKSSAEKARLAMKRTGDVDSVARFLLS